MKVQDFAIKACRKIYRVICRPNFVNLPCEYDRNSANMLILNLLNSDQPCMISRYGTIEIDIVTNYLTAHSNQTLMRRCINFIMDDTGLPWWDKKIFKSMHLNAGIFPENIDTLDSFSKRYLKDTLEIDILGSYTYKEKFMPLPQHTKYVHLECLYPFWADTPWTKVLEGKKVLVVHPFTETISSQYKNRERLFKDTRILPKYELKLLKAVQSNAGADTPFKTWEEALNHMEKQISNIDFDICIIGCGAYGLPLAAHVKRIGKKAIHLGGGSQLLWGIKGKRWDNNAYHWKELPQLYTNYSSLYNDYWVRPSAKETPSQASNVENACYW